MSEPHARPKTLQTAHFQTMTFYEEYGDFYDYSSAKVEEVGEMEMLETGKFSCGQLMARVGKSLEIETFARGMNRTFKQMMTETQCWLHVHRQKNDSYLCVISLVLRLQHRHRLSSAVTSSFSAAIMIWGCSLCGKRQRRKISMRCEVGLSRICCKRIRLLDLGQGSRLGVGSTDSYDTQQAIIIMNMSI